MNLQKKSIITFIAVMLGLIAVLTLKLCFVNNDGYYIQGEAVSHNVDIATRVQGRAVKVHANVGDNVKAGQLLLELKSPALEAQKMVVESQHAIAEANRTMTYSTRAESIEAQKAALEKSNSDLMLAQKSYERVQSLFNQKLISPQQLDEAKNKLDSATNARDVAQANYTLATNGASPEAKKVADAQLKQAEAALNQINVELDELKVKAPIDGQITTKIAEIGQLYNPGTPLYSIVNLNDIWLTFFIREDLLHGIKIGDEFKAEIPALNKKINVKITAINALGQYANWKSTKATGDFDLKTFEIRAKPTEAVDGLRPGMSAMTIWSSK